MDFRYLARQKEFESPTFRLGGGCSIQLSYWRINLLPHYTGRIIICQSDLNCIKQIFPRFCYL